jgi:uncharacterized protein (TIGR00369 family)
VAALSAAACRSARASAANVLTSAPDSSISVSLPSTPAGSPFSTISPAGNVLGAFLAAMLYDTVGPALLATLGPDEFQSTLQMNVDFLRPTRPGRVRGRGRVRHRDGDHAVVEAELLDSDGALLATATAVARVIGLAAARGAV